MDRNIEVKHILVNLALIDVTTRYPLIPGGRIVPSRYLSIFWDERRLGIRLWRARGLMGREEGKIPGGGGTPLYKTGIHLVAHFGLELDVVFEGTLGASESIYRFNSESIRKK